MTHPLLEPTIAAHAYTIACGDILAAVDIAIDIRQLLYRLEPITEATVFRGALIDVDVVKADPSTRNPGKAQINYSNAKGEPESIETGWLTGAVARYLARRAKDNPGKTATFWKLNDEDPTNKRAQGFRHLVWLKIDAQ